MIFRVKSSRFLARLDELKGDFLLDDVTITSFATCIMLTRL